MFLSRPAITVISSIGASSLPVVSVLVLYKIKNTTIDVNSLIKTFNANEDVLISVTSKTTEEEKSVEQKEEPSEPKGEEQQTSPKPPEEKTTTVTTVTTDNSPPTTQETSGVNEGASEELSTNDAQEDNQQKLLTDDELKGLLAELLSGKSNKSQNSGDTNNQQQEGNKLENQLQKFVKLLNHQKNTLKDDDEKTQITEVINALQQLETKIKENKK